MKPITASLTALFAFAILSLEGSDRFITLSNLPMGTKEEPLVLRTYFPDPGLGREVMANHDLGFRARKYSPGKGDVDGFVDPIRGIPGAIGVNFGSELSICWDTTECRLLYAWQGGFLDMTQYWGKPESGRRKGFDYVPSLVGELIYLARGSHPVGIFDHYTEAPKPVFTGYRIVEGVPEFSCQIGKATIRVRIEPGEKPLEIVKKYTIEGAKEFGYFESGYKFKEEKTGPDTFTITLQGKPVSSEGAADEDPDYSTDNPNAGWGEALYTNLGCFACHSKDGTRGHGPSFAGLFGAERTITGFDRPVTADESYIEESIVNPMAKVVDTYPAGYMPPYPIDKKQIKSLTLFIKTLADE
ncbi:MAG: hypothetical protein P1U58_02075 [Verrucomicrobiales bacterium]|nr:hypothetical protein [Verrucomicrobiales bacterium]